MSHCPRASSPRFLHDKPSDRQDLVVKLLDLGVYERMQKRANSRAAEGKGTIALAEQRLGALADCTEAAETDARATLAAVKDARARIKEAAPRVEECERDARGREGGSRLGDRACSPRWRRSRCPTRSGRSATGATRRPRELKEAGKRRTACEPRGRSGPRRRPISPTSRRSKPGWPPTTTLAEAKEELAGQAPAVAEAERAVEAARAEPRNGSTRAADAQQENDAALEQSGALELAATLVVGQPCPVCAQVVARRPKASRVSPSKTKQALEAARKLEAAARTAADAASKRCEGLLADRRNLAKRVSALEQKVAAAGTRRPAREAPRPGADRSAPRSTTRRRSSTSPTAPSARPARSSTRSRACSTRPRRRSTAGATHSSAAASTSPRRRATS